MGVDLVIYIKKDQLKKLLKEWYNFEFLRGHIGLRWHTFVEEEFKNEDFRTCEKLDSKTLYHYLAETNEDIPERSEWAPILRNYDLIFAPDTTEISDENYVDLNMFDLAMQEFVVENCDKILEKMEKMRS